MSNLLISPVGEILFCAVSRAIKNKYKDNKEEFTIRLLHNGNTPEGQAWREQVAAVNENKISTKNCDDGYFTVNYTSKYKPELTSLDGSETISDDLFFNSKTDTGLARVVVTPDTRGMQGTVHLKTVAVGDLNIAEKESSGDDIRARLAELAK